MANEEQLEILKQGVEVWNQWRKDNPGEEIDLRDADLNGANLSHSDLSRADLSRADLSFADLNDANLGRAHLWEATITGVCLYNTARDDWTIDGVECDYVYWDYKIKDRIPKDRDFRPGEFEELYRQLPTFDYVFEHGFTPIDAVLMDSIVQDINAQNLNFELKIDSFHSRGQPHATFTVLHKESLEEAEKQVKSDYESRIAALEGKQEQMMQILSNIVSGGYTITAGGDVIISDIKGDVKQLAAGKAIQQNLDAAR